MTIPSLPADVLGEYFLADPLLLPTSAIQSLIGEMRRRRSTFASEEAARALADKKKKPKPSIVSADTIAAVPPISELSLSDLD